MFAKADDVKKELLVLALLLVKPLPILGLECTDRFQRLVLVTLS